MKTKPKDRSLLFFLLSLPLAYALGALTGNFAGTSIFGWGEARSSTPMAQHEAVAFATEASPLQSIQDWRSIKQPTSEDRIRFLTALTSGPSAHSLAFCDELLACGYGKELSSEAITQSLSRAFPNNFSAQWAAARTIGEPLLREAVTLGVIRNAAQTQPSLALDLLSKLPGISLERSNVKRQVLNAILTTANADTINSLAQTPSGTNETLEELIKLWAQKDASAAFGYLSSSQGLRLNRTQILKEILPKANAELLVNTINSLPDSNLKTKLSISLFARQLAANPEKWDEMVADKRNPAFAADLAKEAALQAIIQKPAATTKFLDKINSDQRRRSVAQDVTGAILNAKGANSKGLQAVENWTKTVSDPIVLSGVMDTLKRNNLKVPESIKPKKP